ncbi:MAG: sodium/glutamate symporter [Turneriella sp.]
MSYFLLVLLILGAGSLAGKRVGWLDRFRIPPSLTTGILLLLFFTALPAEKAGGFFTHLKSLPSEFIALVYACFFLQRSEPGSASKRRFIDVFAQTSLVWVSVMGQVLISLVCTILIYKPFFGEAMAFTSVLETGFAGGHGTAVAMGPMLVQNGIPAGLEYGLFSATVGLMLGIAGGVWLIHHNHRRRTLTHTGATETEIPTAEINLHSLLMTMALIGAAYWLGLFLKGMLERELLPRVVDANRMKNLSLPLFAYTLVAGFSIRHLLKFAGLEHWIENHIVTLLADVFLEILIFAGIAIIDVRLLGHSLVPLLSVFALGFIWNVFCHFYLRPKILPVPYSFEIGLINFGMLNGTAATGLMLLKMVDPKFKTPAARVFAESSAITQPFIAGGILTLITPFIVTGLNQWLSLALYGGLLSVWLFLGLASGRQIRKQKRD